MEVDFIHKDKCRICGESNLVQILDLGSMPPANAFLKKEDLEKEEQVFPLAVYFCKNCSLLQLLDVVNPKILFGNYHYMTSTSPPLVRHFVRSATVLAKKFIKEKSDLAVEVGGNDGVLLKEMKNYCKVLNVEPSKNVAELSRDRGVETVNEFFTSEVSKAIFKKYGPSRLIVANNVIAHIDDVQDVFRGVSGLLTDDGTFVFEAHWVGNLIGEGGFDQIYHEHLCYFSLCPLIFLAEKFGLKIFDIELLPIHGQSMRIYAGKNQKVSDSVGEFLNKEKKLGLQNLETFLSFSKKVEKNKKDLTDLLTQLKKEKKVIAGYGATAKGNTLLNHFGIDSATIDFISDTTPLKQGLFAPGSHIPIYSRETWPQTPDYFLLLAWNYADAIIAKEKEYRDGGGKFIIPVPEVKII